MDSDKEIVKREILKEIEEKLDKALESPTVTFSDIEDVVSKLKREIASEVTEKMLLLKKRQLEKNSGHHVRNAK